MNVPYLFKYPLNELAFIWGHNKLIYYILAQSLASH